MAPTGTAAVIAPEVHDDVVAGTPLKVTTPELPKFWPVMFTVVPTLPDVGEIPPDAM